MAVAAVVVTYNSATSIEPCLRSLAEWAPGVEAVVVDNASTDGTLDRVKCARVIANPQNRGFAGAVNQGFQETEADCILVLNPDVSLLTAIDPLVEACLTHGLAAGQLCGAGGPQAGYAIRRFPTPLVLAIELCGADRLWPGNPWSRRYRYRDRNLAEPGLAEQPAGAFLAVRRDVWERLGGFDERFHPIWFEDVDFCRRASEAGYIAWYVPQVCAYHAGADSINTLSSASREMYWYDSLLRYASKHFRPWQYRGVCLAAVLAALPRTVLGMIRTRSLKPIPTGFYLLFFAGRRLVSRPPAEQR